MGETRQSAITLNNGVEMPAVGLGVYLSKPEETSSAVESAIANGYRLIDTAAIYGNEKEVGQGVVRSGIDRSRIFITTKLWISDYGHEQALQGFEASLEKLGLEYLDLYLLHWPVPSTFDATVAAYQAMERLLSEGRVRAIGVCNFQPHHLRELITRTKVVPAVNQVELHPFFTQREVRAANTEYGVVTQAWSPIGGVFTNHPADPNAVTRLLDHSTLVALGTKYGKSPAQVVLHWHIQNGVSVIPKSVHAERIAENIDIFDFALTAADMEAIDGLNRDLRGGPDPDVFDILAFKALVRQRMESGL